MIKNIIALTAIVVSAFLTVSIFAAKVATTAGTAHTKFKLIHVQELDQWITTKTAGKPVFIFDANSDETRQKSGLIPGAQTLASSTDYPLTLLPQDKNATLVFYCANTQCMASHEAAKRAVNAGYKNVSVMADGIQGWVKAGKTTQKADKSA